MNIFGVGLPEMAIILMVALLVFGPKKLPEISRSLGKAMRGFQDASKEFENQFKQEAEQIEQAVSLTSSAAEIAAAKNMTPVAAVVIEAKEEAKELVDRTPATDEQVKSANQPDTEVSMENNSDDNSSAADSSD